MISCNLPNHRTEHFNLFSCVPVLKWTVQRCLQKRNKNSCLKAHNVPLKVCADHFKDHHTSQNNEFLCGLSCYRNVYLCLKSRFIFSFFQVHVFPMNIWQASGAPSRVVAFWGDEDMHCAATCTRWSTILMAALMLFALCA